MERVCDSLDRFRERVCDWPTTNGVIDMLLISIQGFYNRCNELTGYSIS